MKKNKLNRVLSIFLSCSAVAFMMSCSAYEEDANHLSSLD